MIFIITTSDVFVKRHINVLQIAVKNERAQFRIKKSDIFGVEQWSLDYIYSLDSLEYIFLSCNSSVTVHFPADTN